MGSFLRSEKMILCQIFVPIESAYFVLSELGEMGIVQFRDLNSDVSLLRKNFIRQVLQCYDMESKLKYISDQVKASRIKIYRSHSNYKAHLTPNEFRDIVLHIKEAEKEISRLIKNSTNLQLRATELIELNAVLSKAEAFLKARDAVSVLNLPSKLSSDFVKGTGIYQVNCLTGVINREKVHTFETMLWRVSRGNAIYKIEEMNEPVIDRITGTKQYKSVFVICCHGDVLQSQLQKLARGLQASLYTCPNSPSERENLRRNMRAQMNELQLVINQTDAFRQRLLVSVANQLQYWTLMVRKTKAIFHTMNSMTKDVSGKCYIGECWISENDIDIVKRALIEEKSSSISVSPFLCTIETDEPPPTYIKTNKFTHGFQNLIDVYGMATYREANPAFFSIVTFPFLFAIMFGDVGHATIMTFFAIYLILIEKKVEKDSAKQGEIFHIFFTGRYLILMMGFFSLYTGFIYNDFFSISVNLFGTRWFVKYNKSTVIENAALQLHPRDNYKGTPYFIGIDPIWKLSHNDIIFLNSYKMKISIIIGVFHMILGLCVNIINFKYFKETQNIYLEFLPKLIVMCSLFLWLIVMMFMKWIMYSADNKDVKYGTACAPSILVSFINMMMFKLNPKARFPKCSPYLFDIQWIVQLGLIGISVLTLPVMLMGKPLYVLYERKHARKKNKEINVEDPAANTKTQKPEEHFSEIIILSIIETIEYVLGTVSHTASYLRLWALSLAHNELSQVLWNRLLRMGLGVEGNVVVAAVIMFAIYTGWMLFSLAILVVMEGLSAFLHTLRLHWVEFMSKFYKGNGQAFEPFCFKTILKKEEHDNILG